MTLREKVEAKLKSGAFYKLHNCSMCNYPCGWFCRGDQLYYDSGCDCVTYGYQRRPVEWAELDFYFKPAHGHLKNFEAFVAPPGAERQEG